LKKIKYYILAFIIGIFISCNSSKKVAESPTENQSGERIGLLTEYIVNDSIFINDLKNYFPDLKIAENLVFEPFTTIDFISLNRFPQETLTETEFFKEYKDLGFIEFESLINKYDSVNKFSSYKSKFVKSENGLLESGDKKIYLKFSKRINNLVNIEYIIIDKNVDERIVYTPRKGYYLVEFNNNNEIIKRFYILRTVG
jgi:hypothetical protein